MVELSSEDMLALNKERASEIFQNIFSEIFLANCGNPVDFETTKTEINKKMKIQFDETKFELFEKFFFQSTDKNVRRQSKTIYTWIFAYHITPLLCHFYRKTH